MWLDDPSLYALLSSIIAPASIVHGDQDPLHPLAHGEIDGSCNEHMSETNFGQAV
ncbi:hypothetical protein [Nonomuraea rubra]|uniref:hypothetical protein n=1 Tax=Nonomuraea rubra TaxID=46180 RepID=UPI0033D98BB3